MTTTQEQRRGALVAVAITLALVGAAFALVTRFQDPSRPLTEDGRRLQQERAERAGLGDG